MKRPVLSVEIGDAVEDKIPRARKVRHAETPEWRARKDRRELSLSWPHSWQGRPALISQHDWQVAHSVLVTRPKCLSRMIYVMSTMRRMATTEAGRCAKMERV